MQQEHTMIQKNLAKILSQITAATEKYSCPRPVRLVAVSKTKTVEEIKQAYDAGMRHFGQNYVDEIEAKQPQLPLDINWHFIGHLQSNKIKKVLVPNLAYLQTVDRESLADKLQKYLEKNEPQRKLKILIQVKTSDEDSKHGAESGKVIQLYEYIKQKCPNLEFKGLMTIGKQGDMSAFGEMVKLKVELVQKFKQIDGNEFQLSMGMSGDFQAAIEHGSTSVRVGSSIFGARSYPKKQEKQKSKSKEKDNKEPI